MNILITGAWNEARKHFDEIEAHGHHVLFMQQEKDSLPCDPAEIEAVICNGLFLYHDINEFSNLKYIQLTSAGFDRVPMETVLKKGIEIHNARGVYSVPMAEHAIMMILEIYRKASLYCSYQQTKTWKKERDLLEINGKKVLIAGCGSVGTECAKRLKAFNAEVIGIDLNEMESPFFDAIHPISELDGILPEADILILTLPLTDMTEHLIDLSKVSIMKRTSVIINLSRGRILATEALIKALKDRMILGAGLDVFEEEPLESDSELWVLDNVVLTPHVSFIGEQNAERLAKCIKTNLYNFKHI